MAKKIALTSTLQALKDETSGDKVTIGEITESLNHRGFGSLLLGPALLTVLPTGAVPGMPAMCGVFIILISVQIIIGRKYPWLPQKLSNVSFERKKLLSAIEKSRPYTRTLDRYIKPRFKIFSHLWMHKLIALICLILAGFMIFLGFIPMFPSLFALPIIFFSLGLSARDGLMTIAGYLFTFTAAGATVWLS